MARARSFAAAARADDAAAGEPNAVGEGVANAEADPDPDENGETRCESTRARGVDRPIEPAGSAGWTFVLAAGIVPNRSESFRPAKFSDSSGASSLPSAE